MAILAVRSVQPQTAPGMRPCLKEGYSKLPGRRVPPRRRIGVRATSKALTGSESSSTAKSSASWASAAWAWVRRAALGVASMMAAAAGTAAICMVEYGEAMSILFICVGCVGCCCINLEVVWGLVMVDRSGLETGVQLVWRLGESGDRELAAVMDGCLVVVVVGWFVVLIFGCCVVWSEDGNLTIRQTERAKGGGS